MHAVASKRAAHLRPPDSQRWSSNSHDLKKHVPRIKNQHPVVASCGAQWLPTWQMDAVHWNLCETSCNVLFNLWTPLNQWMGSVSPFWGNQKNIRNIKKSTLDHPKQSTTLSPSTSKSSAENFSNQWRPPVPCHARLAPRSSNASDVHRSARSWMSGQKLGNWWWMSIKLWLNHMLN